MHMHHSNSIQHDSKITEKGQATIPVEVRRELGLNPGDRISFEILKSGEVILKKIQAFDYEYHRTLSNTLSEWDSKEDDQAFDYL